MSRALALTIGEPAGIGPDLTLAVWQRRSELSLPPFYLLGDAKFLSDRARLLGLDIPVAEVDASQAAKAFASALPVVPLTAGSLRRRGARTVRARLRPSKPSVAAWRTCCAARPRHW